MECYYRGLSEGYVEYEDFGSVEDFIKFTMRKYKTEVFSYRRIENINRVTDQKNKEIQQNTQLILRNNQRYYESNELTKFLDTIHVPTLFDSGYCCIQLQSGALVEGMFLAMEYLPFVNNKSSVDETAVNTKLEDIGISHNDIHPRNLCVNERGDTFVFDFSEARFRPHSSDSGTLVEDCHEGEYKG
ncbi:unnamed protein product [Ambrosiozyma monospora]|uniref:Unnamed protein product n=1 Tax=Ambrosiozyma monospora TaxID=43982 RepID=A0ACB5TSB9_AMBMO|nr:unnamed protein product [Ambrosiozyma monospora]